MSQKFLVINVAILVCQLACLPTIRADVVNNSESTIYIKPENGDKPTIELRAGETYRGKQDGIALPSRPEQVFKSVDNVNISVSRDGSVNTSGGGISGTVGQATIGGWKNDKFVKSNPDWSELRDKNQSGQKTHGSSQPKAGNPEGSRKEPSTAGNSKSRDSGNNANKIEQKANPSGAAPAQKTEQKASANVPSPRVDSKRSTAGSSPSQKTEPKSNPTASGPSAEPKATSAGGGQIQKAEPKTNTGASSQRAEPKAQAGSGGSGQRAETKSGGKETGKPEGSGKKSK